MVITVMEDLLVTDLPIIAIVNVTNSYSSTFVIRLSERIMKVKSGFILRNIAGEYVLTPRGDRIKEFRDVILMNELSAFIWKRLQSETSRQQLLGSILEEYEVDEETAAGDMDAALEKMISIGIIEA